MAPHDETGKCTAKAIYNPSYPVTLPVKMSRYPSGVLLVFAVIAQEHLPGQSLSISGESVASAPALRYRPTLVVRVRKSRGTVTVKIVFLKALLAKIVGHRQILLPKIEPTTWKHRLVRKLSGVTSLPATANPLKRPSPTKQPP